MPGVADWIKPNWPERAGVQAAFSLRYPGCSEAPWDGLNLGAHVGDRAAHVRSNRQLLARSLKLPAQPPWLNQVHGTQVLAHPNAFDGAAADAIWSHSPGQVCAIMVADCLPILLRDESGRCVAAVHAGWRGLLGGVVEATLADLKRHSPASAWQAWLGPCIGPAAFEVGAEVKRAFVAKDAAAQEHFKLSSAGKYLADLPGLAQQHLCAQGVSDIWRSDACTYSDPEQFFSFRRDSVTGRMAALIWLDF